MDWWGGRKTGKTSERIQSAPHRGHLSRHLPPWVLWVPVGIRCCVCCLRNLHIPTNGTSCHSYCPEGARSLSQINLCHWFIAPVKGTFPSLHQSWLNCLRSPVINFLTRTCQPTPVCLTVLSQLCTVTCLAVPAESCESQVFGVQASPLN